MKLLGLISVALLVLVTAWSFDKDNDPLNDIRILDGHMLLPRRSSPQIQVVR